MKSGVHKVIAPYVRKGPIQLRGGSFSDFYIDIKAAVGDPKVLRMFVRELSKLIDKKTTCVAGSGYGGLPLATAITQKLKLPLVMVRERVKAHGTQEWIDGYVPGRIDKVAIVDDVFTNGTSIHHTERILKRTKAAVSGRYVVVDRSRQDRSPVVSLLAL